mmetsp:Transcript_6288/g.24499  ORF Transcript_6288/g.24499 Transcript_6288/m.24499 type:complete len:232 (-) Transcript_6288:1779-2474(-)
MLRSPRSWLQSTLRRSVSRRRCLSSRRDLRDKLREQQRLDEERAAEARVSRLKAKFEENTAPAADKPAFTMVEMTRHPAFKFGLATWLVSCSVVLFLYWKRPQEDEVDILAKDFDRVYVMEMEIRKQNGGKPPEDPELLVWEAKYRDLYHREDFSMSPWLSKKIERLPGWTWELDDESGLEGTKEMLREKERQRDAKAREKMEQGDVVDRTALRAAETQETIINQIKKWFT